MKKESTEKFVEFADFDTHTPLLVQAKILNSLSKSSYQNDTIIM